MKLNAIDAVTRLQDLRLPPSNRLRALKVGRKGQHSVRIIDQWRICFVCQGGNTEQVEIVDYHLRKEHDQSTHCSGASGRIPQRIAGGVGPVAVPVGAGYRCVFDAHKSCDSEAAAGYGGTGIAAGAVFWTGPALLAGLVEPIRYGCDRAESRLTGG